MTFMAYLNEYRIGKVQQLLAQRNKNMTEIAEAAGFASIKTFNRVFKESTGLSPHSIKSQFLRRNRHKSA